MTQLSLLDVIESHGAENNRESEQHYEKNAAHFAGQCKVIFDCLMSGGEITSRKAVIELNIMDAVRRLHDLKNAGVTFQSRKENKIFIWYMNDQDKINNKKFTI